MTVDLTLEKLSQFRLPVEGGYEGMRLCLDVNEVGRGFLHG